jgi:hypothetical protein
VPADNEAQGLTKGEALMVTNQYVGNDGGYLGREGWPGGRFTYRSLDEFYPQYCDVEVNLGLFPGTSRETFLAVLHSVPVSDQIKILKGIIERCPPGAADSERSKLLPKLHALIARLEAPPLIAVGDLKASSQAVAQALREADTLIKSHGASSAVDRVHTALHGFLESACTENGIDTGNLPSIRALLKKLEQGHPRLTDLGARSQDVTTILNALGTITGALDPIRNNATNAHPTDNLLGELEAQLVINACRSIYLYLDRKLSE